MKVTTTVWACFVLAIVVGFAILEGWAIGHGQTTLTYSVWLLSKEWPLIVYLVGVLTGGAAVHFWWRQAPPRN